MNDELKQWKESNQANEATTGVTAGEGNPEDA